MTPRQKLEDLEARLIQRMLEESDDAKHERWRVTLAGVQCLLLRLPPDTFALDDPPPPEVQSPHG